MGQGQGVDHLESPTWATNCPELAVLASRDEYAHVIVVPELKPKPRPRAIFQILVGGGSVLSHTCFIIHAAGYRSRN